MNKQKTKTGNTVRLIIGISILLVGILLMLYPILAEWVYENRKDSLIETYKNDSNQLIDQKVEEELNKAKEYNEKLYTSGVKIEAPFEKEGLGSDAYEDALNIQQNGIMGYITIPCIDVDLPIYHGIDDEYALENGIGHLEGSSLPVGGVNTHCVLTGHTGLNRAKLFTDLTQVEIGDQFYLHVLNQKLAYEVDQIVVVLPDEVEYLQVEPGEDYCTLITCTPYGINSHRLFVRGHRVEYIEEKAEQTVAKENIKGESEWMHQYKIALTYGLSIIILIVFVAKIIELLRNNAKKKDDLRRDERAKNSK